MAYKDIDGYINLEVESNPVVALAQRSAVEFVARRVNMGSDTKRVNRLPAASDSVIAKGEFYPENTTGGTSVLLEAAKFGQAFPLTDEDLADAVSAATVVNDLGVAWASKHAVKLDNACLGVTVAKVGPDSNVAPFTSLYREISQYNSASNRVSTQGALTIADILDVIGRAEGSTNFDESRAIIIAHPSFKGSIRGLLDGNGNRYAPAETSLSGNLPYTVTRTGVPTIEGIPVIFTYGAMTTAAASDTPAGAGGAAGAAGNALLFVGNRDTLILGARSGPEQKSERIPGKDVTELMFRSRRGFAVGDVASWAVIERSSS